MALLTLNFESKFLNMNTAINVIMPDRPRAENPEKYYLAGEKYKVMWLLHGGYGDNTDWLRKSNIEAYACLNNLVVVMPCAYNSLYAAWPNFAKGVDEPNFILNELMPLVYGWLPVSQKREDNFLAGMSMGGQGVIKYMLMCPEKFAAAAMISTAPRKFPEFYEQELKKGKISSYTNVVEMYGGIENYMSGQDEPRHVLAEYAAKGELDNLPPLYMAIGREDPGYANYMDFLTYCDKLGYSTVHKEFDGFGHEWYFWDLIIRDAMAFFGFDMSRVTERPWIY